MGLLVDVHAHSPVLPAAKAVLPGLGHTLANCQGLSDLVLDTRFRGLPTTISFSCAFEAPIVYIESLPLTGEPTQQQYALSRHFNGVPPRILPAVDYTDPVFWQRAIDFILDYTTEDALHAFREKRAALLPYDSILRDLGFDHGLPFTVACASAIKRAKGRIEENEDTIRALQEVTYLTQNNLELLTDALSGFHQSHAAAVDAVVSLRTK